MIEGHLLSTEDEGLVARLESGYANWQEMLARFPDASAENKKIARQQMADWVCDSCPDLCRIIRALQGRLKGRQGPGDDGLGGAPIPAQPVTPQTPAGATR
jgi:hypothetical protein